MKRFLLKPFIKGSMVMIPLLVTIWLLWSALHWLNGLGITALQYFGIESLFPGMGLAIMLAILLLVGVLFQLNLVSWIYQSFEDALLRFPVIKTLYGAVKDFAAMLDQDKRTNNQPVVLVNLPGLGPLVGFVTVPESKIPPAVQAAHEGKVIIGVYLPMSYMVGGYTIFVPKDSVTELDWSFEDAMRFTLTAGVSQSQARRR